MCVCVVRLLFYIHVNKILIISIGRVIHSFRRVCCSLVMQSLFSLPSAFFLSLSQPDFFSFFLSSPRTGTRQPPSASTFNIFRFNLTLLLLKFRPTGSGTSMMQSSTSPPRHAIEYTFCRTFSLCFCERVVCVCVCMCALLY